MTDPFIDFACLELGYWIPPDEVVMQKEAIEFAKNKLNPNRKLWFRSLLSGSTLYWLWSDSRTSVQNRERNIRQTIRFHFQSQMGISECYRAPIKHNSKTKSKRQSKVHSERKCHPKYSAFPPPNANIEVLAWSEYDRIVAGIVTSGYVSVSVGHWVKDGTIHAWTCKHTSDDGCFCLVTYNKKRPGGETGAREVEH